jgi:phosphonate transport system substrate-binding protein
MMAGSDEESDPTCADDGYSVTLRWRRTKRLWALLAGVLAWVSLPVQADEGYTLGVFPYFSASRLEQIYAPAASDLSHSLGRPVTFRTTSTFSTFFLRLKEQAYDIALIQPMYYVPAVDEFGYLPLARMQEPFKALIIVPEGSPIHTVTDLRGKTIATPPAYVPVVHLAKKALRDHGLEPGRDVKLEDFKSVDACLQQTLIGNTQACVAPPFASIAFQKSTGAKLRTLLETMTLPNLSLVVHRRVPPAERQRILAAVLNWKDSAAGQAVLDSMHTKGFVAATDADYQPVRDFVATLHEPWLPSAP